MKITANRGWTKPLLLLAALLCAAVVICLILAGPKTRELPPDIFGEWHSDDPRYQACFMDIRPDALVIGGADGNIYHYQLKSVSEDAKESGAGHFFTLLCEDQEGMELQFRLHYDAEAGLLSYKNQRDVIWLKAKKVE